MRAMGRVAIKTAGLLTKTGIRALASREGFQLYIFVFSFNILLPSET